MTFYQIMSKNIIKFCFKGRKKSLAGRSLTMSDKEPRYSVTNSPMFRYVTSQKYDLFAFSYKNLALKIKFSWPLTVIIVSEVLNKASLLYWKAFNGVSTYDVSIVCTKEGRDFLENKMVHS